MYDYERRRGRMSRGARRRRRAARVAAPIAVPMLLALTLGIILAVSSSDQRVTHITQNLGVTSSPTAQASHRPLGPSPSSLP